MHRYTKLFTLMLAASPLLAACDQTSTAPDAEVDFETPGALSADLEISVNPEYSTAAIENTEIALGSEYGPTSQAFVQSAQQHFATAQARFAAGDSEGALVSGQEAREDLAEALIAGLGVDEVDVMIDEAEGVVTTLAVDASSYADPGSLAVTLAGLVDGAKADKQNGRVNDAGEKMVRARQLVDHARKRLMRLVDRPNDVLTRDVLVRLQVAQGGKAIGLAERLIGDAPNDRQLRLLARASELQRKAMVAFEKGYKGRAFSLAHRAEIKALQAVVITDGVNERDINTVKDAATALLEEATAVVEAGESAVDLALLKLATRLYNAGIDKLEEGNVRGLVLLWHSATMSAVIIG